MKFGLVRFLCSLLLLLSLTLMTSAEPLQVLTIKYADLGFEVDSLAGYWPAPGGEHLFLGVDLESGDARLIWLDTASGKKVGEETLDGGWIDSLAFLDSGKLLLLCNYSRTLMRFSLSRGRAQELALLDTEFVFAAPFRLRSGGSLGVLTRGRSTSTNSGVYQLSPNGRQVELKPVRLFRDLMERAGLALKVRGLALCADGQWGVFSARLDDQQEGLWRFELTGEAAPVALHTGARISSPALCGGGATLLADGAEIVALDAHGNELARVQLSADLKPVGLTGFPDRDWALVSGLKEGEQQLFLLRGENGWVPEELELEVSRPVRYRADYGGKAWFQTREQLTLFRLDQ